MRVRVGAEKDEEVARAGEAVDADVAGDQSLRLLHVEVARPGDDVDARNGLRAVRERGDRLRTAHRVDLVDAADRARREDGRSGRALCRRRRADDHLPHSGRLGGDDAHDHARGVGRPPARDVDGGAADRALAQQHPLAVRKRDVGVLVQRRACHGGDVLRRQLEPGPQVARQLAQRRREVAGGNAKRRRLGAARVELAGVGRERRVAALAHRGDDRRHRRAYRLLGGSQRPGPGCCGRRVAPGNQVDALNAHGDAPRRRPSRPPSACGRRGWRSAARCTRRSPPGPRDGSRRASSPWR